MARYMHVELLPADARHPLRPRTLNITVTDELGVGRGFVTEVFKLNLSEDEGIELTLDLCDDDDVSNVPVVIEDRITP